MLCCQLPPRRTNNLTLTTPYTFPTAFLHFPPLPRSSDVESWVNNFAPPLPRLSIRTSNTRLVNIYSDTAKQLADVRWGHPYLCATAHRSPGCVY